MKNLWHDHEARECADDLQLRIYTSRLIGSNPSLVMHGGGNTSVKLKEPDLYGQIEERLYVKASGYDLDGIKQGGFVPLRLEPVRKLVSLELLSDNQLIDAMNLQTLRASAPSASVEALLHAVLPHKFVDHSHADAIITLTNSVDGQKRIEELFGDRVVIIPYVKPGFGLAKSVSEIFPQNKTDDTIGLVLMNHGLFTFGDTAKQSYDRMIDLVTQAEDYLQHNCARPHDEISQVPESDFDPVEVAQLRHDISTVAGFPLILQVHQNSKTLRFSRRSDIGKISQIGPATPDHVIYTKPKPLLGKDVHAYAQEYTKYFTESLKKAGQTTIKKMLDPAPRVVLDRDMGMITAGRTAKESRITADLYCSTMDIILGSENLGGYEALTSEEIFQMEYWVLEQAKLKREQTPSPFKGEIVLITGAASGIGKACVGAFLKRGAAVVGVDINSDIKKLYDRDDFLGLECDLTDEESIRNIFRQAAMAFGSVDMLVLNAGIFPKACRIEDMSSDYWRRVMSINLDSNMNLLREAYPYLKRAPRGGRIGVIGSKNVPAPGPGAAAYSASKAALNQLARIVALEWSQDNIRINSLHPNAIYDTAIWTDEVLQSRAEHYGLTVEEYKKNNLLKTEITSKDVAELVAELCGPLFAKVQCAQIPIDGGNERVI